MTDKELKRLHRGELMDIIYTLRKNQDTLEQMNQELKEKLAARELKISKAGSIADAAIVVSKVFEDAQTAADLYLEQIHRDSEAMERQIEQAKQQAAEIIRQANEESEKRKQQTDQEIAGKWALFQQKVNAYLQEYEALQGLLGVRNGVK